MLDLAGYSSVVPLQIAPAVHFQSQADVLASRCSVESPLVEVLAYQSLSMPEAVLSLQDDQAELCSPAMDFRCILTRAPLLVLRPGLRLVQVRVVPLLDHPVVRHLSHHVARLLVQSLEPGGLPPRFARGHSEEARHEEMPAQPGHVVLVRAAVQEARGSDSQCQGPML